VHEALQAQKQLESEGVKTRVVSMPCWEAFSAQPEAYRHKVLPPSIRARVSIEAGVTFGWSAWIGDAGVAIGIDRYGASAPAEKVLAELGLTAQAVVEAVKTSLEKTRA
jgi:transketolase